ALGIGILTV
nr:Chain C, nonameric peptide ligand from the MART-1/Melan-A [synthetic construct]2GTZ_C Chain C, octapeptide from Melan-A/MART-1 [synthetic construct]2GTZ_F Chain F, octapeptide from Melan-A/MART-1 [synthetic construct]4EUP_C Chain C, Melanoma antigen recognized by T-cells 1 [Homo sapiens]4EUP_F Chain F, Melanoma antigen recognized by T-cells 1 [Homo sapiens]